MQPSASVWLCDERAPVQERHVARAAHDLVPVAEQRGFEQTAHHLQAVPPCVMTRRPPPRQHSSRERSGRASGLRRAAHLLPSDGRGGSAGLGRPHWRLGFACLLHRRRLDRRDGAARCVRAHKERHERRGARVHAVEARGRGHLPRLRHDSAACPVADIIREDLRHG
jgi:hypothetical protein